MTRSWDCAAGNEISRGSWQDISPSARRSTTWHRRRGMCALAKKKKKKKKTASLWESPTGLIILTSRIYPKHVSGGERKQVSKVPGNQDELYGRCALPAPRCRTGRRMVRRRKRALWAKTKNIASARDTDCRCNRRCDHGRAEHDQEARPSLLPRRSTQTGSISSIVNVNPASWDQ
jgi:hypothetical protein